MLSRLRKWAEAAKRDIVALWLAARDPRVPRRAKLVAGATAAYALSPIDLIPDFIPFLGYLDDLILVPFGVWLALKLVPAELMAEFRARAVALGRRPSSRTAAVAVVLIWIAAMAVLLWSFWPAPVR